MLTIHHLGRGQSERVLWLCEELGLPYALTRYERNKETILAPPELRAVHPLGAAPVLEDGGVVLAESGAIVDYILAKYGQGRLRPGPEDAAFAPYLYWFHFANGNLQPNMARNMTLRMAELPADHKVSVAMRGRLDRLLALMEARLAEAPYFAGESFTAADIMMVFSLTTMRLFMPVDLSPHPHILAYLQRIGARPAYRRAMERGDPGMAPLLS